MRKATPLLAIGGMVLSLLLGPAMSDELLAPAMSDETALAETGQAGPPPGNITLVLKSVNGSGCPDATAAVAKMSPDKTAFTVTYHTQHYLAKVGPGAQPTDRRVNCQLSIGLGARGFTYAITAATYRGYAHLAKGAWGLEKASYYFQGSPGTVSRQHRIDGPKNDNFAFTDSIAIWRPCDVNRNFNVNTELRVNAGSSDPSRTSFLRMGSPDGTIKNTFKLSWKRCP
jgi:hypothetical protein